MRVLLRQDHTGEVNEVVIDEQDTWNLDYSLSQVIIPALKKYIELNGTGGPFVDNKDVPQHLHRPEGLHEFTVDEHWSARWQYVLNEMLWAFEWGVSSEDIFSLSWERERAKNGRRLFAEYFHGLWS